MKKSSSAVALVLVSAIVLPLGCSRECKEKLPNGRPSPNCQGGRHSGGHTVVPHTYGGSRGATTSSSPRGGFGSSAGAHASGG